MIGPHMCWNGLPCAMGCGPLECRRSTLKGPNYMSTKWKDLQDIKTELLVLERKLINLTADERDPAQSHDVHNIEVSRQCLSEAVVRIDLFAESKTGHTWRFS
jgi:hypothetical protein